MADSLVQVDGARQLRASLRRAGDDLTDLKAAHKHAAQIAANASADLAPRRTGRLQQTIRASGTKTAGIIRAGTARVPYAAPIHWGWSRRHITAQPFLSDGARDSEGRWLPVYTDYVQHTLDSIQGA
ncbi:HK97 gp10 family phage protein [Curtobacterium sp. MCBD17_032]|uniref:HK97 gp10 family phage protein n=1 Tax=Curtobacterium sp. MCBD17_032 TaxID=2175659 RepID=UPI000DA774F7|nr:HK97 gp10 family phage protein [Curtobacterium sp. MCBD17_032]PZE84157.1 HK97 gp10 family phage protein [Curtobacterium sp. MCBD17_032]